MKTLKKIILLFSIVLFIYSCSKSDGRGGGSFVGLPYSDMQGFFDFNGVKEQSFTINNSNGGTITGEQGTKVFFCPNLFKHQNGTNALGQVDIKLKEIFNPSDMIMSNKPTTALDTSITPNLPSRILLSAGETSIRVFQNGVELTIDQTKGYVITLPANLPLQTGLEYFEGTTSFNDGVVWEEISDTMGTSLNPGAYIYTAFNEGWTNSDKFLNEPGVKTTTFINLLNAPDTTNTVVFVVFKKNGLSSVIKFTEPFTNGLRSYPNVMPIGTTMDFLAISLSNGQQYLWVQNHTISANDTLQPNFLPKSTAEIESALNLLN